MALAAHPGPVGQRPLLPPQQAQEGKVRPWHLGTWDSSQRQLLPGAARPQCTPAQPLALATCPSLSRTSWGLTSLRAALPCSQGQDPPLAASGVGSQEPGWPGCHMTSHHRGTEPAGRGGPQGKSFRLVQAVEPPSEWQGDTRSCAPSPTACFFLGNRAGEPGPCSRRVRAAQECGHRPCHTWPRPAPSLSWPYLRLGLSPEEDRAPGWSALQRGLREPGSAFSQGSLPTSGSHHPLTW